MHTMINGSINTLAKEAFVSFTKGNEQLQSSQGSASTTNSKTSKNAFKLALVLHILWHRIQNSLDLKANTEGNY